MKISGLVKCSVIHFVKISTYGIKAREKRTHAFPRIIGAKLAVLCRISSNKFEIRMYCHEPQICLIQYQRKEETFGFKAAVKLIPMPMYEDLLRLSWLKATLANKSTQFAA